MRLEGALNRLGNGFLTNPFCPGRKSLKNPPKSANFDAEI
jgi:hypothetical protein